MSYVSKYHSNGDPSEGPDYLDNSGPDLPAFDETGEDYCADMLNAFRLLRQKTLTALHNRVSVPGPELDEALNQMEDIESDLVNVVLHHYGFTDVAAFKAKYPEAV